jgi:RNA 3'-terminal phosphate cyclase
METGHPPTVQQTREMREVLQRTILLAIRNFEELSGCHVEGVELTSTLAMGSPSRIYGVECRVVL